MPRRLGRLELRQRSPASPTTRAISSRTSRSTIPGRFSSSQVCSSGRSISRTMSSSVRSAPPSGSSPSRRRSRGNAPSWANAAAAAPDVADDKMRSRPSSSSAQPRPRAVAVGPLRAAHSQPDRRRLRTPVGRRLWITRHGVDPPDRAVFVDDLSQFENIALFRGNWTDRFDRVFSSVMMRLIEAIISSIEGSDGDLALSGMEATKKGLEHALS